MHPHSNTSPVLPFLPSLSLLVDRQAVLSSAITACLYTGARQNLSFPAPWATRSRRASLLECGWLEEECLCAPSHAPRDCRGDHSHEHHPPTRTGQLLTHQPRLWSTERGGKEGQGRVCVVGHFSFGVRVPVSVSVWCSLCVKPLCVVWFYVSLYIQLHEGSVSYLDDSE
jgi:hypothetical protein